MYAKSFLTGKRGEGRNGIEDSIALDIFGGRFAVSDGVSKSFLPQVWSSILTQSWMSIEKIDDFPPKDLSSQFRQERDRIMDLLDEDSRMDMEDLENLYHTASATFCGVELSGNILRWTVLGDSCLFLLPEGEYPQCISSYPMPTDEKGHITPYFDNTPYQMLADGRVYGKWTCGERQIEKGVILLMSDAMSAWFIKAHNEEREPLRQLMSLTDEDSFEQWVQEQYNLGFLSSDDESVIIVQLNNDEVLEDKCDTDEVKEDDSSLMDLCVEQDSLCDPVKQLSEFGESQVGSPEQPPKQEDNKPTHRKKHRHRVASYLRLYRMKHRYKK